MRPFVARSQWRDRAGFAPDFPNHRPFDGGRITPPAAQRQRLSPSPQAERDRGEQAQRERRERRPYEHRGGVAARDVDQLPGLGDADREHPRGEPMAR